MSFPEPSSISEFLHDLPRFSYKFASASNQFTISKDYGLSLLTYTALLCAFIVVYLLVEMVVSCCIRCWSNRNKRATQTCCTKTTVVILLGICIALAITSYKQSSDFGSSFDDSLNAVDDSVSYYNLLGDDSTTLSNRGSDTQLVVTKLAYSSDPAVPQNVKDYAAKVQAGLQSSIADFNSYLSKFESYNFTKYAKTPGVRSNDIPPMLYIFSIWIVGTLIVLFVVFANVKNSCCLCLADGVVELFVFVGWLCASVLLAVALGASDFCQEPSYNIISSVPSKYSSITQYYLFCNDSYTNPLDTPLQSALTNLNSLTDPSGSALASIIQWNLTTPNKMPATVDTINQLNALLNQADGTLYGSLYDLRADLECDTLNGITVKFVNAACGGLLTAAFYIIIFNLVVAFLFVIIRYFSTCGVCRSTHRYGSSGKSLQHPEGVQYVLLPMETQ